MSVLVASVCTSILLLIARSITSHAGVIMFYDGFRREQYRKRLRTFTKAVRPYHEPARDGLRTATQEQNSPFGRALARWIRPVNTAPRHGDPGKSRGSVNTLARTGLLCSGPILFLATFAALAALRRGDWNVLGIEVLVVVVANLVAWRTGLLVERRGPAVTLATMLIGAALSGTFSGRVACTLLPADLALTAAPAVALK